MIATLSSSLTFGKKGLLGGALCWALLAGSITTPCFAEEIRVSFVVPNTMEAPFWANFSTFASAAAKDLGIQLQLSYSPANSYTLKKKTLSVLDSPNPPDYFISILAGEPTKEYVTKARARGVKYFIVNSVLGAFETKLIGKPRERYKNWIGIIGPDDVSAGYVVADTIINAAKKNDSVDDSGTVRIGAVAAPPDSHVGRNRIAGLEERINNGGDAILVKTISSDWNPASAKNAAEKLLSAHPDINAIWTASDNMALMSREVVKEAGMTPGKDIFIAGCDWDVAALDAVGNGELAGSVGGHFMDAGWALVLIYDFHNGIDFAEELGNEIVLPMHSINKSNLDIFRKALASQDWDFIDFKQFSKALNPKLKKYDFSLETVMKQIKK